MTVSVEVFEDSDTPLSSGFRNCVGRTKVGIPGVFSQAVEVCGKFDHDFACDIFLKLRCPECGFAAYSCLEIKNVLIWEESSQEFVDDISLEVDIQAGECAECLDIERERNTCILPCYGPDCDLHPREVYEYDPYDGWKIKSQS